MQEFFKPWRRKFGVVTLVLACVFLAWWGRSLGTRDTISIATGKTSMRSIITSHGSVMFVSLQQAEDSEVFVLINSGWQSDPVPPGELHPLEPLNVNFKWRWKLFGFGFGKAIYPDNFLQVHLFIAPILSIVFPLTLLSAWLLLRKPISGHSVAGLGESHSS